MSSKKLKSQFLTKRLVGLVLHNAAQVVLVVARITVKATAEEVVSADVLITAREVVVIIVKVIVEEVVQVGAWKVVLVIVQQDVQKLVVAIVQVNVGVHARVVV
ncbi:hypothetical protein [uncultured Treponema sp.]|uniref:hypothetical protein n=1 Tax=uncultured Treponema sp. TaxID=162155 RepID=UPI0025FF837A|nr:hypothetical protein [uncultured Treponema sp.]